MINYCALYESANLRDNREYRKDTFYSESKDFSFTRVISYNKKGEIISKLFNFEKIQVEV